MVCVPCFEPQSVQLDFVSIIIAVSILCKSFYRLSYSRERRGYTTFPYTYIFQAHHLIFQYELHFTTLFTSDPKHCAKVVLL